MPTHLPSLHALRALSNRLLDDELRLVTIRQEAAIVRTLADEIERVGGSRAMHVRQQLVEELARLGRRALEMAATMTTVTSDTPPEMGGIDAPLALTGT